MLISPIDRNRETKPEKQVSRVDSPHKALSTEEEVRSPRDAEERASSLSEGIVLRMRRTRLQERRKMPPGLEAFQQERRIGTRRKKVVKKLDLRWNIESHHMLVIGLERKIGKQEHWKAGDRVSAIPQTGTASTTTRDAESSHFSEGLVMRMRGTRLKERRKVSSYPEAPEPEQRMRTRRRKVVKKMDVRWSIESHHILLIALEHKIGKQEHWKSGDRVSVVPRILTPSPKPQTGLSAEVPKSESSLLNRSEEDYVFHLKSYLDNR